MTVDDERSDTVLWLKRNCRGCSEADNRPTPTSLTCTVTQAFGEWVGARSRLHHQFLKSQPLSVGILSARFPSVGSDDVVEGGAPSLPLEIIDI
jgi:hypothetical protein